MTAPRTITIRATCDHYTGGRAANGAREVAVRTGETRRIADPRPGGAFYTVTRWGTRFGLCRLGSGWAVVEAPARKRQPHATIPPWKARPVTGRDTAPSITDAAIVGAFALYQHGEQAGAASGEESEGAEGGTEAEEQSGGADEWPL